MPRVLDQTLPPELAGLYRELMGNTYPIAHTGAHDTTTNEITRGAYPPTIEPPHVPTANQLRLRAAFDTVSQLLEAAPYNERKAYWALSLGSGMHEVHFYRHRHIGPVYHGADPNTIPRPLAVTMPHNATWWSMYLTLDNPTFDELSITYDIEMDPGTPRTNAPPYPSTQYYFWEHYGVMDPNWSEYEYFPLTFSPTQRTRYTGTVTFPARANCQQRAIYFFRNLVELTPVCVIWSFVPTVYPDMIYGYQCYPVEIYPEKWPDE